MNVAALWHAWAWVGASGVAACSTFGAVWWSLRQPAGPGWGPASIADRLDDLEAHYGQLIAHLRELHLEAPRVEPAAHTRELHRVEAQAQSVLAQLLRARQAHAARLAEARAHGAEMARLGQVGSSGATAKDTARVPTSYWAQHPQLRGMLWGSGGTALAVTLGLWLQRDATPVAPSLVGATQLAPASGLASAPVPTAADGATLGAEEGAEKMRELGRVLQEKPDDVPSLLRFAHLLLRAQMLDEAQAINERALRLAPNDIEALTHAAVLSAGRGDAHSADVGLDMVLRKDPTFAEAWFFRGMLALQRQDLPRVRASFAAFLTHAPQGAQRERVANMLQSLGSATEP